MEYYFLDFTELLPNFSVLFCATTVHDCGKDDMRWLILSTVLGIWSVAARVVVGMTLSILLMIQKKMGLNM